MELAVLEARDRHPERVDLLLAEALPVLRQQGDTRFEAIALGAEGVAALLRGRFDDARAAFTQAEALHQRGGRRRLRGGALIYLALAAQAEGALEDARRLYHLGRGCRPNRYYEPLASAGEALLALEQGARRDAEALRAAMEPRPAAYDPLADALDAVAAALLRGEEPSPTDEPARTLAGRILGDGRPAPRPFRRPLRVAPDGAWFATPSGQRVDLGRRFTLRRLLAALANARAGHGGGASHQDLIAACWPEESRSLRHDAAINRLFVSINRLRNLGLGDLITTTEDGYRIESEVELVGAEG